MNSEILDAIQRRRSNRVGFDLERSVSEQDLGRILEAGQAAPTFANAQNFDLIVVDNPQTLRQICELPGDISSEYVHANFEHVYFGQSAHESGVGLPARDTKPDELTRQTSDSRRDLSWQLSLPGITLDKHQTLIFAVSDFTSHRPGSTVDRLALMSLGCVIENLWLATEATGLGMCMLTILCDGSLQSRLKPILHIPEAMSIAFVCGIGYPKDSHGHGDAPRRSLEDFVHRGTYRRP